jgi:PAS domain S-box-containing protein
MLDIPNNSWKSSDVLDNIFGIDEAYERSVEGWLGLIHPDDRRMMADYFTNEVLGQGRYFDKAYRITRNSDHAERWVYGLGELEFDEQGLPLKMIGTIQDITDQKRAEEALMESSEFNKQIIESAQEGIIVYDKDLKIIVWNPLMEQLTGLSAGE